MDVSLGNFIEGESGSRDFLDQIVEVGTRWGLGGKWPFDDGLTCSNRKSWRFCRLEFIVHFRAE